MAIVLVCEPGRKLVHTWNPKDKPEVAKKRDGLSRVPCEITPMGPQVRLRLIHEDLLPEDIEKDPNTFRGINNGWPAVIISLKSLLETGEAIAFSPACLTRVVRSLKKTTSVIQTTICASEG